MHVVDQGVVYDATTAPPDRRVCAWTNAAVLSDGRLLVSFHAGSAKDAPDENTVMRLSADAGRTWETVCAGLPPLTLDGKLGSWHDGRVTELAPGHLQGAFWWLDRSDPSRPMCHPTTTGTLASRTFVMDSFDDGRTWVDRREVPWAPFPAVALMGGPLRMADGAIGIVAESWKEYDDPSYGIHRAVLAVSHDGGHTFDTPAVVATDPANRVLFWDQRIAVDPESGKLVGMFWTHDRVAQQDANAHIAWGTPDGQQWTYPVDAGFAGQIPNPLVLPGGRLLAVYVHRHHPPSLRALLSPDLGRTWDLEHELVYYAHDLGPQSGMAGKRDFADYYADMAVWSFGHTMPALLPSGEVFVSYYAGQPGMLSVRWARIAL